MKVLRLLFVLAGLIWGLSSVAQTLVEQLHEFGFDSIRKFEITQKDYSEAWEIFIRQPLDHDDPDGGYFTQRVFLRHRGFDLPVVLVTEGYAANYALRPGLNNEIADKLEANLIIAEHRYFGQSKPDSLEWEHLNLKNVATDLHRITTTFKKLYHGSWLSTGISKGGQTSIYYRYFYPDDVQASVPYVAPLNFSDEDDRVYHFLDTVADAECRERIYRIQYRLLKDQHIFLPMFADSAKKYNHTFELVGGIEKAFEYNVLEFSFAYWQWYPVECDQLPEPNADADILYNTFIKATGYDFFADKGILINQPFFYQALTEMGMYNYQTKGFEDVLQYVEQPNFHHTLPQGVAVNYDPTLSLDVDQWLKKHGNNMIYVYGAYDAWSATAVQIGTETNAVKLLLPMGSHRTRLHHFDQEQQDKIRRLLLEWLQVYI